MSAFLSVVFVTFGAILLFGNGLPYGNLFYNYENRDDYYEDYYLRKIPKLKTTPEKVKQFFINHLSWFPAEELEKERSGGGHKRRSCNKRFCLAIGLKHKPTGNSNTIKERIKMKIRQYKNYTKTHHDRGANWTNLKAKSEKGFCQLGNYVRKKNIKGVLKNLTHPLRYRGPFKKQSKFYCNPRKKEMNDNYTYLGPSVRIHPKSGQVKYLTTSTARPYSPYLDTHFSFPRKIKVIIDLETPEKSVKTERNVNYKYLPGSEGDSNMNTTNVLETAGEMASDLAGRVTSLWHSVLGSHRIPDTRDVKFYLYTRRNIIIPELLRVNYDLISKKIKANPHHVDIECVDLSPRDIEAGFKRVSDENRKIIKSNYLNIRAPTKILIHGYTGSYKDSRMAKIKDAYLSRGRYNVIQVDWEILAAPPCYIRVTHHSKFVGETIARFLDGLYLIGLNMSLVHLVGFSLGAQVAGFAGNNATIAPVCRITGLDPALPLFLHTDPSGHLDRFDAKFVDVIHTCGGILAMLDPLGHVDFYPNGGTKQPGCEFSNLKCSHSRATQYFAESVVSEKKFTGQLCLSWEEYVGGNCNNSRNISNMGEPCSRK